MTDRYKQLMDNIPGVFYQCACDEHWTMKHISVGIVTLTGYSAEEIVGNQLVSFASLIHPDDSKRIETEVLHAVEKYDVWDIEYRLRRKDNSYLWVSEQGLGEYDEAGNIMVLNGFVADISQRKMLEQALQQSEERVRNLAFYDTVTGLPNRNYILDRIKEKTSRIKNKDNFAILFVDLDGFKSINDKHGHAVGDKVLDITGKRMLEAVDENDTVARIGGDEFLIFCDRNIQEKQCALLAHRIVESISRPMHIENKSCTIGASIGIKISDTTANSVDNLIAAADAAMYSAKSSGTNLVYLNNFQGLDRAA